MMRPRTVKNSWEDTAVKPFNDDSSVGTDAEGESDDEQVDTKPVPLAKTGVCSAAKDEQYIDKKLLKKFLKSLSKDRKKTLAEPVPVGLILQCRVQRSGDKYFLNLDMPPIGTEDEPSQGCQQVFLNDFLIASKKRKHKEPAAFLFSMDQRDLSRHSEGFIGKLKSDIRGTSYHIYDDGERPSGSASVRNRCELAIINFRINFLGTRGPRKLTMYLPPMDENGHVTKWQPSSNDREDGLCGKRGGQMPPFCMKNKKPVWNEKTQSYQLNYHGRASVPSVKNFQLIHETNIKQVFLQLGKISKDTFILDFQYPFSPMLAFATAIASFAGKRLSD